MCPVSVVIMAKNEAAVIGETLQSIAGFTDDIVLVNNNSTDETVSIAEHFGCRVINATWQGYGPTKNLGIDAAKYDWILSLDADERPDKALLHQIANIDFGNETIAYDLNFKTYFGKKQIRFGEWGVDHHVRLVNRKQTRWSDDEVHEQLVIPAGVTIQKLGGAVHHYTIADEASLRDKFIRYAELNALKYHGTKKASAIKIWGAPAFSFLKNYIFKLGFLDGTEGYTIAKLSAYYTWLKYSRLKQLSKTNTGIRI
jgi:glycosyltransferase involved in cell wall biosynthesis